MYRTQISLTEEQHRFLVEVSRQSGESISEIIRRAVDRLRAEEDTPNRRALRLIGAFEADRPDVSVRHDKFLWGEPADDKKKERA
jgi:Arc/MetJ-type ribon-helix-helix transcriptional regulator